jgi:two-component system, OmpR family, sensor kinase
MTKERNASDAAVDTSDDGRFFSEVDVEFIIHELKNPLAIIDTAVHMLLDKPDKYGPLTDQQRKTLKRALRNSKKARNLLADLLEVGRSDAGCVECCRFDPLVTIEAVLMEALEASDLDCWEALQQIGSGADRGSAFARYGIRLAHTDDVRRSQLCQDEIKFRQIMGNLVSNALQHRRRCLEINIDCRENWLIINVIDDGPGVEKENRERIFARYTRLGGCDRLSRRRHGLGLAGARILARHLGGDICVKNAGRQGAVFCLTLPLNLESSLSINDPQA